MPAEPAIAMPLRLDEGGPGSEGLGWLATKAEEAHFFLIGDTPGIAETSALIAALLPRLDAAGYGAYAVELGPWMAANVEDIARRGGDELARFLGDPANARQAPVLGNKQEAALLRLLVDHWGATPRFLWGLDQEFLTSAPFLLDRLALFAATDAQRAAIAAYRREAQAEPFYLARAPDSVFADLHALFAEGPAEARALIDEMATAKHIYGPFLADDPRLGKAHARRERLMEENFHRFWNERLQQGGGATRVLARLSMAHLHRHQTPAGVPSLGRSLHALAATRGGAGFSLAILCGPGGRQRLAEGGIRDCGDDFTGKFAALTPYLASRQITLFPSMALGKALAGEAISPALHRLIDGYDAIVVVGMATPTTPFETDESSSISPSGAD